MRVLWLSSSPGLGAEAVGGKVGEGGGWVGALQAALRQCEDLCLSVAFPWDVPQVRSVPSGRHEFLPFPCYPRGGRLQRALLDLSCRLEPRSEVDHLLRVVELARPDLIHVWGTEAFFGLVAEHTRIPVLIEIQGLRGPQAEGYFSSLTKLDLLRFASPRRLARGRSLLQRFYRYRRTAVRERRILATARYVSGRTDWDHSMCSVLAPDAEYFHCDRLLRAPFYQAPWRLRSKGGGELRLVTTIRGNAYKGLETLIRCASLLRPLLPAGLRWTVVGVRSGEEIHRIVTRKLKVSFEALGVRLVGRQSAEGVFSQLLDHDIYVHPARIENSPNGLCEAMLTGMPIVSTNAGGIPSLLSHGEEGLLVSTGDPWAMAGAILQLARDRERAASLGAAARNRAQMRHDPTAVVKTEIEIYRRVLADAVLRETAAPVG